MNTFSKSKQFNEFYNKSMSASTVEYQTTSLQCIHHIKDLIIKFHKEVNILFFERLRYKVHLLIKIIPN